MTDRVLFDHEAVLERIRSVTGCRTQQELAAFLGIRQSSISDAKRRRAVPAEWLLTLLRETGVNPDWIVTGHGARRLRPDDAAKVVRKPVSPDDMGGTEACAPPASIKIRRPAAHCTLEELVTEIVRRGASQLR